MDTATNASAEVLVATERMDPKASDVLPGTVVYSTRCPDKPTANEDAAAVFVHADGGALLVVADGMGGAMAGDRAAQLTIEALQDAVTSLPAGGNLRSAVLDGIEQANRRVLDLKLGAGCTLAVVELQGRTVRPYHVGDAAIAVFGQRGKIKAATVAHSPVSMAIEAGVLDDDEAMHHEDRHLVTNAVGLEDMRIEIGSPLELSPYDTLVLASDGLLDNLRLIEVVESLRTGPLTDAVTRVVGDVERRMIDPQPGEPSKPDDLTVIAYRASGR
ncbi:MAG: protein phosphatase 2C domain-containing protein [Planctomycetota bacterium]